jgi:putative ABC transport system permease protein
MIQDVRVAFRSLAKARGFTVAALLTLGLGIGANTVVFSLVNALLLRPLPFGEATDRIVSIHSIHPTQFPEGWDDADVSYADLNDVARESVLLEDVGGYLGRGFTLYEEEAIRIRGGSVTPNLFDLLGVEPILGRSFQEAEGALPGFESVAILSYGLWQSRFGGDLAIVGKTVRVNEREIEVIGVMPPRFRFPEVDDLWVPYDPGEGTARADRFVHAVARLRVGTSMGELSAELDAIADRLARRYPETNRGWGLHALPYRELVVEPRTRLVAKSLLGAVGLVLLIGCANLASLLLARGTERQREFSVRAALGAGRGALLRQLLAESLLLGGLGGILGTLLALWGIDALVASFPEEQPYWFDVGIDARVVAFIIALSLAASFLFGLLPALRVTGIDLLAALGSGRDPSSARRNTRGQFLLVAGQVGASLGLLVGAGLMFQSFLVLTSADAGFDQRRLLTFRALLSGDAYDSVPVRVSFFGDAIQRIEALPGVRAASATTAVPTDDGGSPARMVTPESPVADGSELGIQLIGITEGFFETLDVPLVEGRAFDARDLEEGAGPVAILNRRLAERLWPRESAAGREVGLVAGGDIQWLRVVGVAPDVQYEEFGEETAQSELNLYFPYSLAPSRGMAFLVRVENDPAALASSVRDALRSFAPGVPLFLVRTMEEIRYFTTWEQRLFSRTFVGFAVAAFLLAGLGTYGLIAYRASRRVREIGVRVALGATYREVLGMLLREGTFVAGIGLALGLPAAYLVSRILEGILFRIPAVNVTLYLTAACLLSVSILLASYIPARHAARIDPMTALRQD